MPWISRPFAMIGPLFVAYTSGIFTFQIVSPVRRVERDQARFLRANGPLLRALEDQLVAVERETARRDVRAHVVLPDQPARARVERLQHAAVLIKYIVPSCTIGAG